MNAWVPPRDVVRRQLPGQVGGLAALDASGPVFVTTCDGRDPHTTVLLALDVAGRVQWRRELAGRPGTPRVGVAGTVWVSHRGPGGDVFTEVTPDGSVVRSVMPERQAHEHLGAFVVLPDGFCAAWLPADRGHAVPTGGAARLVRHLSDGGAMWSTPLPLGRVAFPGVIETGVHTDRRVRPKRPWTPDTIRVHDRDPLLWSSDRVLVGVADGGSGIGVCIVLDSASGRVVATTEPAPYLHKAITGPGGFLIGRQGYGAFSSTLHDRDGRPLRTWPSHGMMLVDGRGRIRGPETENVLPSRSLFRVLEADGSLRDGPPLSGYYTTGPAMDRDGTVVFWRDGRLLAVDLELRVRELFALDDDRAVMSRILLLEHGTVVFSLHDELFVVRDTALGTLDTGPWPCSDGNLQGNPVRGTH